jgi:hypothetical protein
MDRVANDVANHFGVDPDDVFDDGRVGNFWVNEDAMKQAGVSVDAMADFLTDYRLEDNLAPGERAPDGYGDRLDEKLFAGSWPTAYTEQIAGCVS